MTTRQALALILVVALVVTAVTPARAEALEPTVVLMIIGAGVVVVALVAYLVIANVRELRGAAAQDPPDVAPVLVAFGQTPAEAP